MKKLVYSISWLFILTNSPSCTSPDESTSNTELAAYREQALREGWTFQLGETPLSRRGYAGMSELSQYESEDTNHFSLSREGETSQFPTTWDWRWFGVVSEIRDQALPQYCGSCWAFGTVAATESAIMIRTGKTGLHLSEQQVVSCSNYGTCQGGYYAFEYYRNHGAAYEKDFPYKAENLECPARLPQNEKIMKWGYVGGNEDASPTTEQIKEAIYKYGPVAATVSASGAWKYYKGGVYNECNTQGTNHIVALVGWDDTDQVWILKNSHGTEWGEQGFMRIKYRGSSGRKCNNVGRTAAYVTFDETKFPITPAVPQ